MRIYTMQTIVGLIKRAHDRLVLEHEEVVGEVFFVKQVDPELVLMMHERTEGPVDALLGVLEIGAVARLEAVGMVHLFHDVVRIDAIIVATLEIAFFAGLDHGPAAILLRMVVDALF